MHLLLTAFIMVAPESLRIKAMFLWRAVINQVLQFKHIHISLECVTVKGTAYSSKGSFICI